MNLNVARQVPRGDSSHAALPDRRQAGRSRINQPCVYVFNATEQERLTIHTGPAVVHDISTGGMCIRLNRKPPDHGILEIRTLGPGDTDWVWLLGITWTRRARGSSHSTSLVGGKFLFGCCTN